mmetsp:Transcript_4454/g.9422  ORF Transcript_4454/g.9422 Transcript_4454/m.9422 type:complete len:83 (-) Transcript_4454:4-252(-)
MISSFVNVVTGERCPVAAVVLVSPSSGATAAEERLRFGDDGIHNGFDRCDAPLLLVVRDAALAPAARRRAQPGCIGSLLACW